MGCVQPIKKKRRNGLVGPFVCPEKQVGLGLSPTHIRGHRPQAQ